MKSIQAYAPASMAEDEIDQFYKDTNRALAVPGCSQTFLNAQVSKQLDEAETVMYTIGIGVRKDRGST